MHAVDLSCNPICNRCPHCGRCRRPDLGSQERYLRNRSALFGPRTSSVSPRTTRRVRQRCALLSDRSNRSGGLIPRVAGGVLGGLRVGAAIDDRSRRNYSDGVPGRFDRMSEGQRARHRCTHCRHKRRRSDGEPCALMPPPAFHGHATTVARGGDAKPPVEAHSADRNLRTSGCL